MAPVLRQPSWHPPSCSYCWPSMLGLACCEAAAGHIGLYFRDHAQWFPHQTWGSWPCVTTNCLRKAQLDMPFSSGARRWWRLAGVAECRAAGALECRVVRAGASWGGCSFALWCWAEVAVASCCTAPQASSSPKGMACKEVCVPQRNKQPQSCRVLGFKTGCVRSKGQRWGNRKLKGRQSLTLEESRLGLGGIKPRMTWIGVDPWLMIDGIWFNTNGKCWDCCC